MITESSLFGGRELLMQSDGCEALTQAFNATELKYRLANHGVILLRGFTADVGQFSDLIQQCSTRVTLDPARRYTAANTQLVDAGTDAIGLHLENGNAPLLPDIIWFYCEQAATAGSQTTICDGEAALKALPAAAAMTLEKPVAFERRVPDGAWQRYVIKELGLEVSPDVVGIEHIRQIEALSPNTRLTLLDDGAIRYRFETHAIHPTQFSETPAFANSLLGPSNGYEPPLIEFADRTPISESLWAVMAEATESVTNDVDWVSGDVVVIDNTRYMHGRRAILDNRRIIHNAQSYL